MAPWVYAVAWGIFLWFIRFKLPRLMKCMVNKLMIVFPQMGEGWDLVKQAAETPLMWELNVRKKIEPCSMEL